MNPGFNPMTNVGKTAKVVSSIRDRYIQMYGFDIKSYGCLTENELTEVGEVSYFAKRQPKILKFYPSFKTKYGLLAFAKKGMVDELVDNASVKGYVRSTDDVNEGDLVRLDYSFYEGTVNVKYYIVTKVLVTSIVNPIGKEIFLTTYTLPISKQETNNKKYDYSKVDPNKDYTNDNPDEFIM